jgi:hypothetical protein
MLRIDIEDVPSGAVRLRMQGQVIGAWVEELERVCEPLLADGGGLALDLSGVGFVSREGAELLRRLRERGAALHGCSRLVAEQLKGAAGGGR